MGYRSVKSKRRKRKLQKAKKKKSLQSKEGLRISGKPSGDPQTSIQDSEHSTFGELQSQETPQECNEDLDSSFSVVCGEDMVAVEMRLEDEFKDEDEQYPRDYLLECRERLCVKVQHYRSEVEALKDKIAQQSLQHRKQLDQVRDFYRNIAYARTRAGEIVRRALVNSTAAEQLMKELHAQHKSK